MRPLTEAEKFRAKGYTNYPEDLRDSDMPDFSSVVCRCNHSVGMHAIVNTLSAGKCGVSNCVCVKYESVGSRTFNDKMKSSSFVSFASMSKLVAMDDITKLCLQVKHTTIPCTDVVHDHICEVSFKDHGILHVCGCHFTWRGRFKAWEKHERERQAREASL